MISENISSIYLFVIYTVYIVPVCLGGSFPPLTTCYVGPQYWPVVPLFILGPNTLHYWVLLPFYMVLTGLTEVQLGPTSSYWAIPHFYMVLRGLTEVLLGPTEAFFSRSSTGSCCGTAFHPGNACSTKGIRPTMWGSRGRGCVPAVGVSLCLQAWWHSPTENHLWRSYHVANLKVSQNSIDRDKENFFYYYYLLIIICCMHTENVYAF